MRLPGTATKWCHVTWSTARHRKWFNLAAQARFCERTLKQECDRHGWAAEVALLVDRIHILVEVPAAAPRDAVVARLRELATRVVRRAGAAARVGQVWEGSGWCSVLTNAAAVAAVRRHIRGASHQASAISLERPATSRDPGSSVHRGLREGPGVGDGGGGGGGSFGGASTPTATGRP